MSTPTTRIAAGKGAGKVSAAADPGKEIKDVKDAKGKKGKTKKKKSKKKLIIIGVVVLVLLGGGYKMMAKKPAKVGPPVKGVVVAMEATTLNLTDGHFLKLKLGLQTIEGKVTAAADGTTSSLDTSEAADIAVSEFTNRSVASLSTDEARAKVKADLLKKLQKAYPDKLMGVYFIEFVMQ